MTTMVGGLCTKLKGVRYSNFSMILPCLLLLDCLPKGHHVNIWPGVFVDWRPAPPARWLAHACVEGQLLTGRLWPSCSKAQSVSGPDSGARSHYARCGGIDPQQGRRFSDEPDHGRRGEDPASRGARVRIPYGAPFSAGPGARPRDGGGSALRCCFTGPQTPKAHRVNPTIAERSSIGHTSLGPSCAPALWAQASNCRDIRALIGSGSATSATGPTPISSSLHGRLPAGP